MHCKSYSHFFSKIFQHICVSLVNYNESLTNDIVSFEQLGPGLNKASDKADFAIIIYSVDIQDIYSFAVNTINIFIMYNENISVFASEKHK